jgi:hypothetical protein
VHSAGAGRCRISASPHARCRRRQDALWRGHALRTLPALLDATDMMVCGEDLGFVPACVPPVMEVGVGALLRMEMAGQQLRWPCCRWQALAGCGCSCAQVFFTLMPHLSKSAGAGPAGPAHPAHACSGGQRVQQPWRLPLPDSRLPLLPRRDAHQGLVGLPALPGCLGCCLVPSVAPLLTWLRAACFLLLQCSAGCGVKFLSR